MTKIWLIQFKFQSKLHTGTIKSTTNIIKTLALHQYQYKFWIDEISENKMQLKI